MIRDLTDPAGPFVETIRSSSSELEVYWGQQVCYDCIHFIANGDLPEDKEDSQRILFEFSRYSAENIEWRFGSDPIRTNDDGEDEVEHEDDLEYSSSECDCCGSSVAGSRYASHFVVTKK